MKTKVYFITNLIPPYRIFLFNKLNDLTKESELDFKVLVMSETENGRYWKLNKDELKFKYIIDKGFYKYLFNKFHLHINFKIIYLIIKERPDKIILGASWNDLNIIIISFLKKVHIINSKISFWSEANYLSELSRKSFFKTYLRKFVLNTCDDSFIIPGKMAEITLFDFWNIKKKPIILLPNIVDNDFYHINDTSSRLENKYKRVLIIARLVESKKGIINFLSSIDLNNNIEIRIAGDGVDYDKILNFIKINDATEKIKLLGNIGQKEILKEYKSANLFVLPSFQDPSPLTLVEASFMKLPLFVSENCGNKFETLIEGVNGFSFNPKDKKEINNKFNNLIEMSNIELENMGNASLECANKYFNPQTILKNFIFKINR